MPGASTAVIVSPAPPQGDPLKMGQYSPYFWAGVHYLRRSGAAFLNSTWLDAAIMILKPKTTDRCTFTDPFPMAACLSRAHGDARRPDLMISTDPGTRPPERIAIDPLARSLGLQPLRKQPLFAIYARPGLIAARYHPLRQGGGPVSAHSGPKP